MMRLRKDSLVSFFISQGIVEEVAVVNVVEVENEDEAEVVKDVGKDRVPDQNPAHVKRRHQK